MLEKIIAVALSLTLPVTAIAACQDNGAIGTCTESVRRVIVVSEGTFVGITSDYLLNLGCTLVLRPDGFSYMRVSIGSASRMLQNPCGETDPAKLCGEWSLLSLVREQSTAGRAVGDADFAYVDHLESAPEFFNTLLRVLLGSA